MQDAIIHIMENYGYLGILVLIVTENVFPPIPSEIILTFGGFMTTFTSMTPIGVILYSTVGAVLGAYILFGVGILLSPERIEKLLDLKVIRMLGFKKGDIVKAMGWFDRRGKLTVLICRCVPIVRSLISIPAGMAKMNKWVFGIYTLIGTLIWNTVLVTLGVIAGASWEKIAEFFDMYSTVTLFVIGAIVIVGAVVFIVKRKNSLSNDEN